MGPLVLNSTFTGEDVSTQLCSIPTRSSYGNRIQTQTEFTCFYKVNNTVHTKTRCAHTTYGTSCTEQYIYRTRCKYTTMLHTYPNFTELQRKQAKVGTGQNSLHSHYASSTLATLPTRQWTIMVSKEVAYASCCSHTGVNTCPR